MKILLTDIHTRKAFDIYHIIKQTVPKKDIIISSNRNNLLFSSLVYRKKNFLLRNASYENFEKDLKKIIYTFKNEDVVYIPVEENTTLFFCDFIAKNKVTNLKYLLPSRGNFQIARNKKKLTEFCHQNRIPAPKLYSKQQVINNINNDKFVPVICKPQIGSGAKGIVIINSPLDKKRLLEIDDKSYVIQELLPDGKNVNGAFFLMEKGKLISAYGHKRIRTFPVSGGVTVYSKIDINEKLISIGSKLLKLLNWSGFAMIEFLWDPVEKVYKVIEINPRLWGSILLSEFGKTNFLENYINLTIGEPVILSKTNLNAKIRWLLFDVLNLVNHKISFKEFFNFNERNTCYINGTYANWWAVFWFHFFFIININNFKKLLQKWRKK